MLIATKRQATRASTTASGVRSEEHTSELQSRGHLVCRLLLEKKIVVSPFHFIVELKGSVDLKHGGSSLMSVSLDLELDGPNPWHVSGTASAHILFITVSVIFDHSFGDPNQVTLPAEDPTPKLLTALNDVRSWNAALPSDFFFYGSLHPRNLHSFPTRRSSD